MEPICLSEGQLTWFIAPFFWGLLAAPILWMAYKWIRIRMPGAKQWAEHKVRKSRAIHLEDIAALGEQTLGCLTLP